MKRQRVRQLLVLSSFLVFPITIFYFSPFLIIMGALEGVIAGSAIAFGLQFVAALLLGRLCCGWICPAGGLQEIAMGVTDKPAKLGWRRFIKYVIWVPWIASIAICAWVAGGFFTVDPLYHIPGGISVTNLFSLAIYFAIVVLFFVPNLFLGRRAMCHYICWMAPFMVLGEKLGRLMRLPQVHIAAEPETCIGCGKCNKACPMSLDVQTLLQRGNIADAECIQCGECVDTCPKKTLSFRFGRVR